ncbi:MAG: IS66 family transposase, partial [Nitrospirae bacterium]|nr:IS66 family transposase [Nitrospirota bacterium]
MDKNSQNSSKPPSTDHFKGNKEKEKSGKSKRRKAGGQPGHKGTARELVPVEDVDHIIDIYPE